MQLRAVTKQRQRHRPKINSWIRKIYWPTKTKMLKNCWIANKTRGAWSTVMKRFWCETATKSSENKNKLLIEEPSKARHYVSDSYWMWKFSWCVQTWPQSAYKVEWRKKKNRAKKVNIERQRFFFRIVLFPVIFVLPLFFFFLLLNLLLFYFWALSTARTQW